MEKFGPSNVVLLLPKGVISISICRWIPPSGCSLDRIAVLNQNTFSIRCTRLIQM